MATAKSVSVQVGSKKVDPYHVTIQQRSDWHHRFEIAVSSEKIEDAASNVGIDQSIEHVGKTAQIDIQCTDKAFSFTGIITSIRVDRTYTGDNLIIFSGYSPTYLLEDGVGTKSFAEKDIKRIVDDIFGIYPSNLLNAKVEPQYSDQIPYIVQYKETNYQFLSRIAEVYGEWFFFDGKGIIFGKLPNPESIELMLGKDLDSFDYGVQLRPSKFKYQFYNYAENRMTEETSTDFKPGWLDNYGKKALDAADSIFPSEPINPTWQDTPEDSLIEHLTETRKSSILSDTTFFKGHGSNSGLTIGSRVQVKANNKVDKDIIPVFIGNFRVTTITHRLNANKDYSNDFEAIPVIVTAPLVNENVFKPEAESQVAVVKENNDPDSLGRVRVQFKWQSDDEMTPWIRQVTNYASKDRGFYFVPELEDEVYIDFVQGNPDRPFMQGSVYHSKTAPEYFDADNNLKAIKTRSGHTILLDDKDGNEMITIKDKKNNQIILDTKEESITISAPKKILIKSEEIEMKGKNITISASSKLTEKGNNIEISAGNELNQKGKNVTIGAQQNLQLSGDMAAELVSNQTVDVSGKVGVTVASDAKTEVGATGMLELKSSGITSVQGSLVKIN